MKIGPCVLALLLLQALSAALPARANCPVDHLQPTTLYGSAFGSPVRATTEPDLGHLSWDEELEFQYFEYQSRDEPQFQRVFAIHVLANTEVKTARVFLVRLRKDGEPVRKEAALSLKTVALIKAIATPVLRNTRYRTSLCLVVYTDGHVIQAGVAWRGDGSNARFLGGEAYAPIMRSPAAQIETIGRGLRKLAEGELKEVGLRAWLQERGIFVPE